LAGGWLVRCTEARSAFGDCHLRLPTETERVAGLFHRRAVVPRLRRLRLAIADAPRQAARSAQQRRVVTGTLDKARHWHCRCCT